MEIFQQPQEKNLSSEHISISAYLAGILSYANHLFDSTFSLPFTEDFSNFLWLSLLYSIVLGFNSFTTARIFIREVKNRFCRKFNLIFLFFQPMTMICQFYEISPNLEKLAIVVLNGFWGTALYYFILFMTINIIVVLVSIKTYATSLMLNSVRKQMVFIFILFSTIIEIVTIYFLGLLTPKIGISALAAFLMMRLFQLWVIKEASTWITD